MILIAVQCVGIYLLIGVFGLIALMTVMLPKVAAQVPVYKNIKIDPVQEVFFLLVMALMWPIWGALLLFINVEDSEEIEDEDEQDDTDLE